MLINSKPLKCWTGAHLPAQSARHPSRWKQTLVRCWLTKKPVPPASDFVFECGVMDTKSTIPTWQKRGVPVQGRYPCGREASVPARRQRSYGIQADCRLTNCRGGDIDSDITDKTDVVVIRAGAMCHLCNMVRRFVISAKDQVFFWAVIFKKWLFRGHLMGVYWSQPDDIHLLPGSYSKDQTRVRVRSFFGPFRLAWWRIFMRGEGHFDRLWSYAFIIDFDRCSY